MKRQMDREAIESLAVRWFDALRRGKQAGDDPVHLDVVALTFFYEADVQWQFVLFAVDLAGADEIGYVAAGPFEGLMGKHGAQFIDQVEFEAKRDRKFADMVCDSYQHLMSDEIWARVQAIQANAAMEDSGT